MGERTTEGPARGARVESLESVRGVAAFLVVLYHVPGWNRALYEVALIRNGYLMVELFFVLSGFVIFRTYSTRLQTLGDVARFQFLRFGRLYPVHVLMLFAYVVLEALKFVAARRFGLQAATSAAFVDNDGWAVLQHLFLLQAIGPLGRAETFNIPAWSISVEFYTYFLFATLLLVLKDRRWLVALGLLLSLGALTLLATGNTFGWQYLMRGVAGFFLGCGIAFLTEMRRVPTPKGSVLAATTALVLFLSYKSPHRGDVAVFGFAALLVLCLVADGGTSRGTLSSRPLRWLGDISYSLYMTHAIVLWVANQTIRVALRAPQSLVEGVMTPQLSLVPAIAATLVSLLVSLAVAQAMSVLVERPWRLRSRRFVGVVAAPGGVPTATERGATDLG